MRWEAVPRPSSMLAASAAGGGFLAVGARVRVEGLVQRPEYNGLEGIVVVGRALLSFTLAAVLSCVRLYNFSSFSALGISGVVVVGGTVLSLSPPCPIPLPSLRCHLMTTQAASHLTIRFILLRSNP